MNNEYFFWLSPGYETKLAFYIGFPETDQKALGKKLGSGNTHTLRVIQVVCTPL